MKQNTQKEKKKPVVSIADCVGLSADFKDLFYGYFSTPGGKEMSLLLNKREKKLNLSEATHRQINSWDSLNLLNYDRDNTDRRKYSVVDAVWVNILFELRNFGYTVDKAQLVKKSLEEGSKITKVPMPLLEFCIGEALTRKKQMVLLLFSDGSSIPIPYKEYQKNIENRSLKNHICINLSEIIQRIYSKLIKVNNQ